MAPRTTPTLRQRRLGAELRKLREAAGLSTRQAGELVSADPARISNTEAGRFGVSPERIRHFAQQYGCQDELLIDALAGMATGRARHWWEDYRETLPAPMLDLAEMEHHSTCLRSTQVMHLPGLLQTVDYARLVFRNNIPTPSPPQIEFLVSHRIKRQRIIYGESPAQFNAVIHEAALRIQFGDSTTIREQLEHIVDLSERDHITVLVVPFESGLTPGSAQTVMYGQGPVPQLDTVQLDTEHGAEFLHAAAQLAKYRTMLDRTEAMALGPTESRDLIWSVLRST